MDRQALHCKVHCGVVLEGFPQAHLNRTCRKQGEYRQASSWRGAPDKIVCLAFRQSASPVVVPVKDNWHAALLAEGQQVADRKG